MARQMIALAGVGGLGKYICEELLADAKFDVVVISRAVDALVSVCIPLDGYKDCIAGKVLTKNITQEHRWASSHQVAVHQSDYSTESVLSILNLVQATALVSFVHLFDARWITIHTSFLSACRQSTSCKRFIPSEFVADAEKTPVSPAFYGSTRAPFREILRNPAHAEGVEWTLFNTGWFMDYLLPQKKTYIRHAISDCPIDVGAWRVNIKGTGDEAVSWVCGRDVGKAIVELLKAKKWERSTYVSADWKTFNEVVNIMESFYGRSLEKSNKSVEDIRRSITRAQEDGDNDALFAAQAEEYAIAGCAACPREITLRQRKTYFSNVQFWTIEELLKRAETTDFV